MTDPSRIVRDLGAEIDAVSSEMAKLNHPNMASERAGLVGRLADLKVRLAAAEVRVQFEGKSDDEIEAELLEAGSELETLPGKLAALENVPGAKYRRAQLAKLQESLQAQVQDLEVETTTRSDAAKLAAGLAAIATHRAEAARKKGLDQARAELSKLEEDIRENGYRGHGPQIEAARASIAKFEALAGTPVSEQEIAAAKTQFIEKVEQREVEKMAAVEESAAAALIHRQRTTPRQLVV